MVAAEHAGMRTTAMLTMMVLAALAGCAGSDDHGLAAARKRWSSHVAPDYAVTWHQECFCPPEAVRPIRLEVSAGAITKATYVDDHQPVDALVRPGLTTIDGVFDLIEQAIDRGEATITVEYDPTWSFPSRFAIDPGPNVTDGGTLLRLSDFALLTRTASP
jgi:hypothetical protein